MPDEYVTKENLALQLENMTLKITQSVGIMFDEKISILSDRIDESNIEHRNSVVLELTGESWDNRGVVRATIQRSKERHADDDDTRKKVKTAFLGFTVPVTIAVAWKWMTGG